MMGEKRRESQGDTRGVLSTVGVVIVAALTLLGADFARAKNTNEPAKAKTEAEFWEETGIDQDWLIETKLNTPNCYLNAANYLGCVYALNELAGQRETPAAFVPTSLVAKDPARYGRVIFAIAPFQLVEAKQVTEEVSGLAELKRLQTQLREDFETAVKNTVYAPFLKLNFAEVAKIVLNDPSFRAPNQFKVKLVGAANAYLRVAVDAHARLVNRDFFMQESRQTASVPAVGIGVVVFVGKEGSIVVGEVLPNSPAKGVGIQEGDQILVVDDFPVTNVPLSQVVEKIRGQPGQEIRLRILRDNQTLDLKLRRAAVQVEKITHRLLSANNLTLGYVRVRIFMDDQLCSKVDKIVKDQERDGARGIILDLRDNPGGKLELGICLTGTFVGGDKVAVIIKGLTDMDVAGFGPRPLDPRRDLLAIEKDPNDSSAWLYKTSPNYRTATSLPVVVLINSSSASASEIVAGALRDHRRAWLVGMKSFGKGSVQVDQPLQEFGSKVAMFRTAARFYQPSGTTNQLVGILPDFEVFPLADMTEEPEVMREADSYPGALSAMNESAKPPRAAEAGQIKACVERRLVLQESGQLEKTPRIALDHQLNYAEQVLACQ